MSLTKLIALNYSDGTNTLYNANVTINVPFKISHIRISNCYVMSPELGPIYQISCPMLQSPQSDSLTVCREYTPTNEIYHYYETPKTIDGVINFNLTFGPELYLFDGMADTQNILSPFIFINAATFVPIGCTIKFAGMIGVVTIISQFNGVPNGVGEYQMSSPQTINLNTTITMQHPNYGIFYNMIYAKVALMIEFYHERSSVEQHLSIPRQYMNSMYFTWRFVDNQSSIQNIDVPFNVDEIQITASNLHDEWTALTVLSMIGLYTDLLYSDSTTYLIPTNSYTNPLTCFSITSTDSYEATNKLIYKYPQSRIIRGSYKVWANYLFSNIPAPLVQSAIQILFIKY